MNMRTDGQITGWRWTIVFGVALAMIWPGGAAWSQRTGDHQTISGFNVPEYDRENRLRSRLFGEFARIYPDGRADITGMRILFYDDEQKVEMRVTAETCLYHRVTRNAESKDRVRIARSNMIITGKGFSWRAEDGQFEIREDTRVVLRDVKRTMEEDDE